MIAVPGCIDEGDWALMGTATEIVQQFCALGELDVVSTAKLVPTFRIMAEPNAELRAWSDLLDPLVELGVSLTDTARPQPIDEDSCAVRLFRRLIDALEPDVRRGDGAADDSGYLRKQTRRALCRNLALELDFGA